MKLRVYLDTSVFSALFDDRVTDRKMETEEFWEKLHQFEAGTSDLAERELLQTANSSLRGKFTELLKQVSIVESQTTFLTVGF